ncbi:hypothetical protein BLA60_04470 [Actinophytocola xinjiangensis]|uniref:ScoMcrA-like DNA sulfur-binding domain-containing protein n=1 Tax=Actinophytocola xinjiangensis TaxID=485602 RepID=A0A7Z0WT50_9PSEU|nr:hypothetical protein BLA60_04470 [Actinophytocola xinjiangensis]
MRDGHGLSLLLESAGDRSRNDDYVPASRLLLARLRDVEAVVLAVVVPSARLVEPSEDEGAPLGGPVDLADVPDVEELRLRITGAQDRVGLPAGAKKDGNKRQRLQLRLAVPGYGPDSADRLAEYLADPVVAPPLDGGVTLTVDGLLTEIGRLKRHRTPDGRASLHKPLALLWMADRIATGGTRLVAWPEFRRGFGAFLREFAPATSRTTPEYPFWHLGSSRLLWEVHGVAGVPRAADRTAAAGLTRQAAVLLRDEAVRGTVIDLVVNRYLSGDLRVPPRARDVLRPLVGVRIRTVSGQPNMVLAMNSDTVTVGTKQSPEGQPVPLVEVQKGLDLLVGQRSVGVNVEELGYRSAFVGAVLATLPTARVAMNPATIALGGSEVVDPSIDATDAVTQVKIRKEQARLRKLLAGGRDVAPCALCGDEYPIEFLVAAHVKRRAVCADSERHDLLNVAMLACGFGCDILYETGWITVDSTGRVRTAPLNGVPDAFRDRTSALTGRPCRAHHTNSEPYFAWHRTTIFRGSSHQGRRVVGPTGRTSL